MDCFLTSSQYLLHCMLCATELMLGGEVGYYIPRRRALWWEEYGARRVIDGSACIRMNLAAVGSLVHLLVTQGLELYPVSLGTVGVSFAGGVSLLVDGSLTASRLG
jgi:hypothetical protein